MFGRNVSILNNFLDGSNFRIWSSYLLPASYKHACVNKSLWFSHDLLFLNRSFILCTRGSVLLKNVLCWRTRGSRFESMTMVESGWHYTNPIVVIICIHNQQRSSQGSFLSQSHHRERGAASWMPNLWVHNTQAAPCPCVHCSLTFGPSRGS